MATAFSSFPCCWRLTDVTTYALSMELRRPLASYWTCFPSHYPAAPSSPPSHCLHNQFPALCFLFSELTCQIFEPRFSCSLKCQLRTCPTLLRTLDILNCRNQAQHFSKAAMYMQHEMMLAIWCSLDDRLSALSKYSVIKIVFSRHPLTALVLSIRRKTARQNSHATHENATGHNDIWLNYCVRNNFCISTQQRRLQDIFLWANNWRVETTISFAHTRNYATTYFLFYIARSPQSILLPRII